MAEIIGPAPEAMSNDQIVKTFSGSLSELTKAATDPTYNFEKTVLLGQARQQWMMVRGFADSMLGMDNNEYGQQYPNLIPFDSSAGQEETGADIRLNPNVSYIAGDMYKFCEVMGSSSPRVKGVADDLRSPEDISAAHIADTNIRDLWTKNKIDRLWKVPAFHLYTTGPCFARTFWNTDAIKYGQSIEPKIEVVTGPDGMPLPQVVGEIPYANGDAEVSFHSVLEVSIPWEAKELRGNFLQLERMVNKWALISKYPGKNGQPGPLDAYRDSNVPDDEMTGASVTAAEAREATSNPSGTAKAKKVNQWRFSEWWIPPHLYESILSEDARTVIKNQFSRGLYIARVGSIVVEIDEREVTEEWAVVSMGRGEKLMERPICADSVQICRAINDLFGMAIETVLRAITQTLIDNLLIDRQAMSTRAATPSELILTSMPVDGDLRNKIYQIPPAHLSDQVLPLLELFRTAMQDITGIRPELSGGGAPSPTYRQAKQAKDQALAQLAPQAQSMRDAAEDVAHNLVVLRSKYGSGTVKAQRKTAYGVESDVVDIADLQASGWHTESDDDFPLTLSDKRDTLYSLLHEFSPEVSQTLSLLDPLNIDQVLGLLQLPGFESAMGEQKTKTLADIDKLLQAAPIPSPPGPPGQPPAPPMPSIPVDLFDDHQLAATIYSRWLVSSVGQKHAGTPGFYNVMSAWSQHHKLAQPPTPPPPPPVKGTVAWSGKLEDFPSLVPEILVGSGLPAPPPPPPAPPVGGPPRPSMAAPPGIGSAAPKPPGAPQANPIPPLPQTAGAPPPPIAVQ